MALTQDVDMLTNKLAESERSRKSLLAELNDQLENKDDTGKLGQ